MANIPHWFTDTPALCASDAVDLVSVCVKVPDHAAVVRAALAAGKHILCEWPLGCAAEEADALASEAARAGVHHAIGLQASASSAVRRARELITQGRLGRLRSARSSGCVASIEIGGDRPPDTPFTCEIIGDAGTLCLFGGHMHGFQVGELRLEVDGENVPLDASRATGGLKGAPRQRRRGLHDAC